MTDTKTKDIMLLCGNSVLKRTNSSWGVSAQFTCPLPPLLIRSKAITDQNDKPVRRLKGSPEHLSPNERNAILDDYIIGLSWSKIAKKHNVSQNVIAFVRNQYLVNTSAAEYIKKARLPKLYEISEWVLNTFGPEEFEEASLKQRGTIYGILQDKINAIEGVTGNVNIAITTMTDLGLLK